MGKQAKKTVTVVGYDRGYDHASKTKLDYSWMLKQGIQAERLAVSSQYGWEDGCQDREKRLLLNARCIEFVPGSPVSLGKAVFKCDKVLPQCSHKYASKTCPKCGHDFCYSCCAGQNVDQGGKHEQDFMLCPVCGHDYYEER